MNASLERRARQVRARAEIRKWEYRQRKHAKGVWFRLRRVLAEAAAAYAIDADDAARLLDEGFAPEPVGAELQPEKRLLFISEERLQSIPGRHAIPLRLGPELMAERNIALVRFA